MSLLEKRIDIVRQLFKDIDKLFKPSDRSLYNTYLKSYKWKKISKAVKERDSYRCRICNSPKDLNIHHSTYERIGNENLEDLITVCRNCHVIIHRHIELYRDYPYRRLEFKKGKIYGTSTGEKITRRTKNIIRK